eukprot:2478265-Amphidinium_carterae.1
MSPTAAAVLYRSSGCLSLEPSTMCLSMCTNQARRPVVGLAVSTSGFSVTSCCHKQEGALASSNTNTVTKSRCRLNGTPELPFEMMRTHSFSNDKPLDKAFPRSPRRLFETLNSSGACLLCVQLLLMEVFSIHHSLYNCTKTQKSHRVSIFCLLYTSDAADDTPV